MHCQILASTDGTSLVKFAHLDKSKQILRIYTRGGILADEMVKSVPGSLSALSLFWWPIYHPCASSGSRQNANCVGAYHVATSKCGEDLCPR